MTYDLQNQLILYFQFVLCAVKMVTSSLDCKISTICPFTSYHENRPSPTVLCKASCSQKLKLDGRGVLTIAQGQVIGTVLMQLFLEAHFPPIL